MKTLQLQRKILNGVGKKNPDTYYWTKTEDENWIGLTDGYVIWTLCKRDLLINLDRLKETDLKSVLNTEDKDPQFLGIEEYFRKPGDKEEYVRLRGKDTGMIYIKSKFLKFFEDYELLGTGPKDPVYVAEEGGFGPSGVIMPIVMKGEYYD